MQVYGATQVHGPQAINAPHTGRVASPDNAGRAASSSDQLDLSEAGQLASRMQEIPAMRQDRVAALRAAIQQGTYETEGKMSVALDRLLDEIG